MEPVASDLTKSDRIAHVGATDGELVLMARAGDRQAFDVLIRRYQRQAVVVSYRLLGNNHDALEVTQDSFLKAFKSLSTLQTADAFGGWFLRIVSNLSLNYRRSRTTRKQLPLDDFLGTDGGGVGPTSGSEWTARSGDPVHELQGRELGQKLQEALKQLPEKQRLAILMFTVDELSQKEVAAALDCSVEAIKWHVFQGRKKLRELLKNQLQD